MLSDRPVLRKGMRPFRFVARISFISLTISFAAGFSDAGAGCCGRGDGARRYEQQRLAHEIWEREHAVTDAGTPGATIAADAVAD